MSGKKTGAGKAPGYPALREFFSGYLHEDFRDEYGSAVGAAEAYREDAPADDLAALGKEWKAWRAALGDASPAAWARAIRQLGGAWSPQSASEVEILGKSLLAPKI